MWTPRIADNLPANKILLHLTLICTKSPLCRECKTVITCQVKINIDEEVLEGGFNSLVNELLNHLINIILRSK